MSNFSWKPVSGPAVRALLVIVGLCCAFSGRKTWAQVDQGAITGIVKDTSGAVIPNATITLTNSDTNLVLQAKSSGRGEYVFSPIKIGNYKVSASAPGFETTTQENVRVDIQDRRSVDIILKPGSVQEAVTVNTVPSPLQSETSSVGQVVTTETINATPLNGRNWVYIAQLTAGVNPGLSAGGARGGGTGDFSANGQRTTQNNFVLDGIDNNVNVDDFQNGASYNVKPPPDALAEFKIDTSDYSAEFGHSAGAVMNVSIKSGTNQIHGDLWEYVRNTKLDAADWDTAGGVPAYHENQFGATLGGPIWKNKLFYFGDVEANRITFAEPDPGLTVPTASERKGDFSEMFNPNINGTGIPIGIFAPNSAGQVALTQTGGAFANPAASNPALCQTYNSICAWDPNNPGTNLTQYGAATTNVQSPGDPSAGGMTDAVASEILNDYPKPNAGGWNSSNYGVPGSGNLYANYNVNVPVRDNTFQWDQRLDWNISAKDQSYARYSYTHDQIGYAPPLGPILDGGNVSPGFTGSTDFNLAQNFMLSETHIFNANLVNEFRFGYNWGVYQFVQMNNNIPANQLIPGLNGVPFSGTAEPNGGLPELRFGGNAGISAAGSRRDVPSTERQNIYEILDNITMTHGSHNIKFGFELQSIRPSFAQAQYPRGYYNFDGQYSGKYNSSGGGVGDTGTGMADAFDDNMGSLQISPSWNTRYYRNYRAAYIQDDWKITPKLTANLGVRYDFIQPDSSKPGDLANLVITSETVTQTPNANGNYATASGNYVLPAQVAAAAVLSSTFTGLLTSNNVALTYTNANPHSLVSVQHYNFAPRVGFAYQIDTKTVVRAAYGLFYGAIEAPGGSELETNYPFAYTAVLYNPYLGNYGECFPSTQTGYQNNKSQCPSNGTADLNEVDGIPTPGASIPNGWAPFPYSTSLETGVSNYTLNGGYAEFGSSSSLAMSDSNIKTPYTQSFNLTIERALTPTLIATLGYVGNNSRHTYAGTQPLGPLAVTSSNDPNSAVPFPGLSIGSADQQWIGASEYNSLQAKLEKHYADGMSFLASYTYAHAEDDAGNPGIGGGPTARNTNLIPLRDEMTNSNYDIRHRFTFNGLYELPFGDGRRYLSQGGLKNYLVGGWSLDATWTAQTGIPFQVGPGGTFVGAHGINQYNAIRVGDPFKGGGTAPAANVDMAGQTCPTHVKTRTNWYNPCAFVDPLQGDAITPGTVLTDITDVVKYAGGKSNQIHGPGWERVNLSGFKNFKTWHQQYFQFRADVFNVFNTPSWGQPADTTIGPTGGRISSAQTFQNYTPDARFFQLAAKYIF